MRASTLLTAACIGTACRAAPIQSNQSIVFGDCPTALYAPGMKCGSLEVPMDWENPSDSKTITLGISKIPARDPSRRIGPLFYNPGGPGVLVSQTLAGVVTGTTPAKAEILDRFDFIGVDLRGSGLSTPITCSRDLYNAAPVFYATTAQSYDALVNHNLAFRQSCLNMTGTNLIDYMDTVSIVHDHEAVRQALGGEKLTWLGQSYGTLLGSQYAELYAENIRGMILDGAVSNSQPETAQFVQSGSSTEATIDFFFTWCAQVNATLCPAAHQNTTQTIPEIWDDLVTRAQQSPIPGKECGSAGYDCQQNAATAALLREGIHQLLYSESLFPYIAAGLYEAAFKNDATIFLASTFHVYKSWGTYNASQVYSNVAISCQDFPHVTSATEMTWWQQIAKYDFPYLRGITPALSFLHQCVGWPASKRNPPHRISIPETLASKVLLVTNIYDPATPSAWGVQLQHEIGEDRAVLIERKKAGHTAYFESTAFDGPTVAAMNHYLLTLEVPDQRTIYDS